MRHLLLLLLATCGCSYSMFATSMNPRFGACTYTFVDGDGHRSHYGVGGQSAAAWWRNRDEWRKRMRLL